MKQSTLWIKMIGSLILGAAFMVTAVFVSWWLAAPANGKPSHLRWHMIAKSTILKGAQLREENVGWKLGWIPHDIHFLPRASLAVGKFALVEIPAETCLNSDNLTPFALATVPENGAVLPVEVKTEYVGGLQPGMRLAFVQNKVLLPATASGNHQANVGFELLCLTTSQRDPAITTLMVKVEAADMGLLAALATDQWRPVVLRHLTVGSPEVNATPSAP